MAHAQSSEEEERERVAADRSARGRGEQAATRRLSVSHTWSIGFKSDENEGYSIRLIFSDRRHSLMTFAPMMACHGTDLNMQICSGAQYNSPRNEQFVTTVTVPSNDVVLRVTGTSPFPYESQTAG
ncbi:hypothetical protein TNCV_3424581 [Trichonephila clavipes]|nr:hypothetical protein TNCV_3424581 [Trichonephila clavipes]